MAENPMSEAEFKRIRTFVKPYSAFNVFVYQLTGGRLMGKFTGADVMLVSMTGAKSGKRRVVPLMHVPYREGVIVVGSQGGAPKSPVWVNNLIANPDVEVQYKSKKMKLRARRADDVEKAQVWPVCVEHYPPYDEYRRRTDRNIPVFICEPHPG